MMEIHRVIGRDQRPGTQEQGLKAMFQCVCKGLEPKISQQVLDCCITEPSF